MDRAAVFHLSARRDRSMRAPVGELVARIRSPGGVFGYVLVRRVALNHPRRKHFLLSTGIARAGKTLLVRTHAFAVLGESVRLPVGRIVPRRWRIGTRLMCSGAAFGASAREVDRPARETPVLLRDRVSGTARSRAEAPLLRAALAEGGVVVYAVEPEVLYVAG